MRNGNTNGQSLYGPTAGDSYSNNGMSVSSRFLITVFLSYCLSVFFWQPLILGLRAWMLLRKLEKNPDKITEALLFLHEIDEIKERVKNQHPDDHNVTSTPTKNTNDHDANGGENQLAETSI